METRQTLTFALAGNANVGKSVIFNQLTGLNQIVGNWPGKTVERAEGKLRFKDKDIKVLDLPGIYSLSTFTIEEIVAREYIAIEKPDVIINIIDAAFLERNLYLTLQLLELDVPMVVALNQIDFAAKKGIKIDEKKLSMALGLPVIPTVAITGKGINELLEAAVQVAEGRLKLKPLKVRYGREIEEALEKIKGIIEEELSGLLKIYTSRWLSVKLFEKDEEITRKINLMPQGKEALRKVAEIISEVEKVQGEPSEVILASERYGIIRRIVNESMEIVSPPKIKLEEKLSEITAHGIIGYLVLICVITTMFTAIFYGGNMLIEGLEYVLIDLALPQTRRFLLNLLPEAITSIICDGALMGIVAGVTIALPYIIPFHLILGILEDSGYLPRAAYLMDNLMHKVGLHGKAFIPLIVGYGCSVPACIGCRIMETDRERFICGFEVVLIPCAARTVVILGLVGFYLGIHVALTLYLFNVVLIFLLGKLVYKTLPGEPMGLIMEMPPYKIPSLKNVLVKAWVRTKDFIYIAFPLIVIGSVVIEALKLTGLVWFLAEAMKPLISNWLGLPPVSGIPLIFGVLRKELTLILLSELIKLASLTPTQMIVFSLVTMIYFPCLATIAALLREFGWKKALGIALTDIFLAILIGGITYRLLSL